MLLEMLREFLKALIEISRIDLHMLNASHRVDGQNFSVFHPHNLSHHLRAVFSATQFFQDQRNVLALCQLHTAKVQDLGAPKTHFG